MYTFSKSTELQGRSIFLPFQKQLMLMQLTLACACTLKVLIVMAGEEMLLGVTADCENLEPTSRRGQVYRKANQSVQS